ncbi:glycosyltransferase [Clostridium tertium]|jgi:hypothetical protein|uniref:glycosyltransferase n=1 Tax=Clostridium tertium TaxID=1559 RepID=UPI000DCFFD64|nr:glycosyltransferase [Clostridium tertium]MDB1941837.1 glycosyltransferase [Clostridium tertium]
MNLAPVVMFVYNRVDHTKKTIEALTRNKLANESILYIFSDGSKNNDDINEVKIVRNYIRKLNYGFKKIIIIESDYNKGLAKSVIDGVTRIINEHKKVIVLEDDIITSENFLEYMNDGLKYYEDNHRIWSISGYNLPIKIPIDYKNDIYFGYRACSWGWATWKDRWEKNDWDVSDYTEFMNDKKKIKVFNRGGNDMSNMLDRQMKNEINSWAIRWCYSQYKNDSYCVYPVISKVKNIGNDGSGTNCDKNNLFDTVIDSSTRKTEFLDTVIENEEILKNFRKYFKRPLLPRWLEIYLKNKGVYNKLKKIKKIGGM